jgi:ribosome biogenesis GTPase / thiamine phosphate phosphatase
MSKRKLTRRQSWRIAKIQEERSARAAKRESSAEEQLQEGDLGPEQHGLIITHFGTQVLVEANGESKRCHFRTNLGSLVAGDQVVWRDGNPYGVVVAVLPRQSALMRPDPYGDLKTVAANIDRLVIVVAPYPEPHLNLIDRYLVAAEASDIPPVILINKIDSIDERAEPAIRAIEELYPALRYQVLRVSTHTGEGLDALTSYLSQYTSAFVGQSGVGKSSLANALLPGINLRVGALSERQTGSHTTTNARLFHFPHGGQLIDSPGIREFGLWHMSEDEIIEAFVEFRPFLGYCKFRDCTHNSEPGCALLAALEEGQIPPSRMASYRQILSGLVPNK